MEEEVQSPQLVLLVQLVLLDLLYLLVQLLNRKHRQQLSLSLRVLLLL